MSYRPFLILHKSEWDRLQRQGGPPVKEPVNENTEYIKALTELSQAWIKTWPESFAGQLAKIEKEKKNQQRANEEFIKAYKSAASTAKEKNTVKAIKEARQLIFDGSNNGRKLLSAFLESRAVDERDAQIKLFKEMQEKAAELAKEEAVTKEGIDFHEAKKLKQDQLKTLDCIRVNKEIVLRNKEKELQEKLIEKQCAGEAEKFMKQIIEIEKKEKDDKKRCKWGKLKEYKADTKKFVKTKEHDEKLTDALTEVHKNEQDRINVKTRAVLKKVHQGRPDSKWFKDMYEKIKQIQTDKNKRYEDFVDKGIKTLEQRNLEKESMDELRVKQKSSSRYLASQINKIVGEGAMLAKKCENKCACDRQSLIMNLNGKPKKKAEAKASDEASKSTDENINCESKNGKLAFIAPRNNLTEELRKREKEPSPWNGTRGEHKQFAEQADGILKEMHHKYFARKVVDEYRELNCLDATTLPIPNY